MTSRSCLYCEDRFEPTSNRRLFCSNRCCVRYKREEGLRCFYCGEIGSHRDHVFPQACMEVPGFAGQEIVNACLECNTMLNNRSPFSVAGRVEFLIGKLTKKYALNKAMPEWDDDELDGLGRNLRSAVAGKIHARQRAVQRLLHMQAVHHRIVKAMEVEDAA